MSNVVQLDNITIGQIPTKSGKAYDGVQLIYSDASGKQKTQTIYQFSQANLYNEAATLKKGDKFKLSFEKNENGYNQVSKIEAASADAPLSQPLAAGAGSWTTRKFPQPFDRNSPENTRGPRVGNLLTNAVSMVNAGSRKDIEQTAMELLQIAIKIEAQLKAHDEGNVKAELKMLPPKSSGNTTITTEIDVSEYTKRS